MPSDLHSNDVTPPQGGTPLTKPRAETGPHIGWPHCAVGMHSAVASDVGLPSRSSSASRMLVLVTPPDVSSSFMVTPGSAVTDPRRCVERGPSSCGLHA